MNTIECLASEVKKLTVSVEALARTSIEQNQRFDSHTEDEHDLIERIIKVQENNAKAITLMQESVDAQIAATKGLVEVYTTTINVGRFVKWLSGFIAAGVAVYTYFRIKP